MMAWPLLLASTRKTATWAFSMRPAVPAYWRCTPTVAVPFFRSPVSSMTSTAAGSAEVLDEVVADVVADPVGVPHRPGQQVLHAVRAGLPGVLGDRPAVLPRQVRQQPQHERPGASSWLHPAEPARDPAQQFVQARLPPGRGYAVACGHRLVFGCRHNTGSSTVAALTCSPALTPTSQVTI
jgi:hypothetical protein